MKKITSVVLTLVVALSMSFTCVFADTATIRVEGYQFANGDNLKVDETELTIPDGGNIKVIDALNRLGLDVTGTAYVSDIEGQAEKNSDFPQDQYPGWMYRILENGATPESDAFGMGGASVDTLEDGDKLTWYYSCAIDTVYSTISEVNGTPKRGGKLDIVVKGQYFKDLMTWELSDFECLDNAPVVIEKKEGDVWVNKGRFYTDAQGKATISIPRTSGKYRIYAEKTFENYGEGKDKGIENVSSWSYEFDI